MLFIKWLLFFFLAVQTVRHLHGHFFISGIWLFTGCIVILFFLVQSLLEPQPVGGDQKYLSVLLPIVLNFQMQFKEIDPYRYTKC